MYEAKNFERLLGTEGFSDALLRNHFILYEGYVSNTNTLLKKMNEIRNDRLNGNDDRKEESAEFHRRYGWEYNGMKLHELYFENMAREKVELDSKSDFGKKIIERFGTYEAFVHNFTKNVGMFRGIGWVALIERDGTLGVIWINEHNEGVLVNSKILLVMDVFEHAFALDYGLKRADYIAAFWNAIDWSVVEKRFAGK